VRHAQELSLLFFGGRRLGPGFVLAEFVFVLVEDFLDVPAAFVNKGDQSRGQSHLRGQEAVGLAAFPVTVGDPPRIDSQRWPDRRRG